MTQGRGLSAHHLPCHKVYTEVSALKIYLGHTLQRMAMGGHGYALTTCNKNHLKCPKKMGNIMWVLQCGSMMTMTNIKTLDQ